jgi:hypothetical protein
MIFFMVYGINMLNFDCINYFIWTSDADIDLWSCFNFAGCIAQSNMQNEVISR